MRLGTCAVVAAGGKCRGCGGGGSAVDVAGDEPKTQRGMRAVMRLGEELGPTMRRGCGGGEGGGTGPSSRRGGQEGEVVGGEEKKTGGKGGELRPLGSVRRAGGRALAGGRRRQIRRHRRWMKGVVGSGGGRFWRKTC